LGILFTDDRVEAFLYNLSRLRKHFTTDTSLVMWLISWQMEGLKSHSTDMNSHSTNSSKIPKCPLKGLIKIYSVVLELSYAINRQKDVIKPRHTLLQVCTVNSLKLTYGLPST
jgi:hypothetical protein